MTKLKSKVNYLTPNWDAPAHIHAVTTLRSGGVSSGEFASFNLATHVHDDLDAVLKNRAILKKTLALPSEPIWLNQVHGNRVLDLTDFKNLSGLETADASFTSQSGIVCAVLTADCLPLLFCSQNGEKIAAVHAGWKGLLAGIISNTVTALATRDLLVWLAPAIGAEKFVVGAEVRELFIAKNPAFATAFKLHTPEKYLADIYQLARIELIELGIKKIYGGEYCTVSDSTRFYSYRRNNISGRMATLLWKD